MTETIHTLIDLILPMRKSIIQKNITTLQLITLPTLP